MADDINLPNLVSHLAVNLDGLNGTVADASRQGSSVGAALGGGVQRELHGLLANLPEIPIDANSDQVDRDLARVREQLQALSDERIGIDIPVDQAIRRINELTPHLQRLSDSHPNINVQASTRAAARQLDELLAAAHRVDDVEPEVDVHVDIDEDRPNRLAGILGRLGRSGAQAGLSITAGFAKSAAMIGSAVPAAGAVVTTLANIAPAAGVAVTGLVAVKLASGTVKLAAMGMEDALGAALDPSKSEEFNEALKKLSPAAANVARTVRDMAPALREVQQSVQDEVFRGLSDNLERTSKSVLPVLRSNLLGTATALGDMSAGVLGAARDLGESGTLGHALHSASSGLQNLSGLPGIVVTALGQIAAAAGPSFEGLTAAAAHIGADIGDRLGKAFESGRMQDAIQNAIDLIGDLVDVAMNVGRILGSVFSAAQTSGGGLVGTLHEITGSLADAFASPEVQAGLKALFTTMSTVAKTVAPLLGQALGLIAPILVKLGPPIQSLIKNLGAGLSPIIDALGPVLEAAAGAVGALVLAAAPLLPVIGDLVAALLPALTPLLEACQVVFEALAPVVADVAEILTDTLSPILAALPGIIEPLAKLLAERLVFFLELLGEILVELGPILVTVGESVGELLVAVAPLIEAVADLVVQLLDGLMPLLTPLIGLVGDLATVLSDQLAGFISNVVVPAVQILADLFRGDFTEAADTAKKAAVHLAAETVTAFAKLPGQISAAVASLAVVLQQRMLEASARLLDGARAGIANAVTEIGRLPSRATSALGNLNSTLFVAGATLIAGFVAGIVSKIPTVQSVLADITRRLPDWKGPKQKDAKILTPAGRLLIEGFIKGITGSTARLKQRLESITKALPTHVRNGLEWALSRATATLEKQVTKRDAVLKKLAAAQKKLDDLVRARSKAVSDIRTGILAEANITTGNAQVNSVTAITVGLQQSLKAAKAFQANIAKLRKAGLRTDLLQQIADAGVEGGSATAAALAKATPAELKKINDLQAQLAKSAASTGKTVGDALYGAGIQAARGLVSGLKSQQKAIENVMREIAENMLKMVKAVHKTKSPSRAFRDIGVMDGEGLRGGLLAMSGKVRAAARTMASAALDVGTGVSAALTSTPSAAQLATVYAGGGGGDQHNTFNLYGSEASPDGILRALSWRGLVGGR
ncbi:hypothetical protein [Streptomyces sp. NPDC047042]|uniref:hypothetical protein n=1 Tax=Streptomyces sp. NPDC047042 TaxID=3154807 RepID=UPI0033FB282A